MIKEPLNAHCIGKIASPLARNKKLFPELVVFFYETDPFIISCRHYGSHHPGRASACYYQISH